MGAALYDYYTHGVLKAEGSSITEGIGQGRITANLEGAPVDLAYQIPDEEALPIVFDLAEHEGLLLGGSSGINVAGAIRLARELGPGHTIVTILCDFGRALRLEAVQSGLPAREEPARPGLAGTRAPSVREPDFLTMTETAVPRRRLSARSAGARRRVTEPRRHRARPHRFLRRRAADSPATGASSSTDGGRAIAIATTIYDADKRDDRARARRRAQALPAAGETVIARASTGRSRLRAHARPYRRCIC